MRERRSVELDAELVDRLHQYCQEQDATVAEVLSGFIAALPVSENPGEDDSWVRDLPPITRRPPPLPPARQVAVEMRPWRL